MGARTKGYIKNNTTGEIMKFMFNPNGFSDSVAITYADISSPGSSYPITQYIGGNAKSITLDLFLYDKKTQKVPGAISFLENFIPKRGNRFSPPPTLIYAFGNYVCECVLESLGKSYVEFDDNLVPTNVVVQLALKVV